MWPNGYFSGSNLSWRFHDPNEEFDELRKAVTPEVQAKLFSAHRMSGFWLYTMTWLPVPVLDYHHASSDDAFTTVFNIPFLFYCGREYVRRPGTNTFYWRKNGVNMDFEDWSCLRSSCLAVHGPGSPPLKPGDPVSGNAIGIRACLAQAHCRGGCHRRRECPLTSRRALPIRTILLRDL